MVPVNAQHICQHHNGRTLVGALLQHLHTPWRGCHKVHTCRVAAVNYIAQPVHGNGVGPKDHLHPPLLGHLINGGHLVVRLINIHGALGQNAVFDDIHIIVKINSHIHALKAVTELIDDVAHKLVSLLLNGAAPNHLLLLKVINTRAVEYHRRLIGGDTIVIALQAGGRTGQALGDDRKPR